MARAAGATPSGAEPVLLRLRGRGELALQAPETSPRRFQAGLPGYVVTPLRRAPAAAARLGIAQVLVKDESSRLGLPSFKILGASWAIYRALLQRLGAGLEEVPSLADLAGAVTRLGELALSAATDGNHGRAVARVAAWLGLEARIYVPVGMAASRIQAIADEGAVVTVVDGGYEDAVRRSAEDAGDRCLVISDTSWAGYEQVPRWVIDGYATIFTELEEQLGEQALRRPDLAVIPVGVGALAAAAVAHFWRAGDPRPRLIGVEPVSAACVLESVAAGAITTLRHPQDSIMAGLNCATPSVVAWPLVSRGIDAYLAVDDARVPEAMRLLAADGITAGETGAAGLAGLLRLVDSRDTDLPAALDLGADSQVLLVCTEGATDPENYARLVTEATGG